MTYTIVRDPTISGRVNGSIWLSVQSAKPPLVNATVYIIESVSNIPIRDLMPINLPSVTPNHPMNVLKIWA